MKQTLLVFFLGLYGWLQSQVYPVSVSPVVIPPYGIQLSEYANSLNTLLQLNVQLNDLSSTRQVYIHFSLTGNTGISAQNTAVVLGAEPISLVGGINTRLSNQDLQANFQFQNLEGISSQQYANPLPDGLYQFCFTVFDVFSGLQISDTSCAQVYLQLNDPPFLNRPENGVFIEESNPTNIIFNWTPRHLNATNVQYEFTLKELWDSHIDPQAAFVTSPALYQTTTFSTTLLYGPTAPNLLPNVTYAWQVRAMVNNGISSTSLFNNNGYSEVWSFVHQAKCNAPQFGLSVAQSPNSELVQWQYGQYTGYKVEYRKQNGATSDWFYTYAASYENKVVIEHLEPQTTYEFRIGGQCREGGAYVFGNTQQFTTVNDASEVGNYQCGVLPNVQISNQEPLERLGVNEVFYAGDFPVMVKLVEPISQGVFTGGGFVQVPYLADTRIAVKFEAVGINTDHQLISGVVETTYDPTWSGMDDIGDELEAIAMLTNSALEMVEVLIENIDDLVSSGEYKDYHVKLIENLEDNLPQELDDDLTITEQALATAQQNLEEAKQNNDATQIEEAEQALDTAKSNYKQSLNNVKEFIKEAFEIIKQALKQIEDENSEDVVAQYQESLESAYEQVNTIEQNESSSSTIEVSDILIQEIEEEEEITDQADIPAALRQNLTTYFNTEIDYNRALVASYFSKKYTTEEEREALADELQVSGQKLGSLINALRKEEKPEDEIIEKVKEVLYNEIYSIVTQKVYNNETTAQNE